MIMDIDLDTLQTSSPRAITQMNKTSWAPYFHPSGEYVIFTSNTENHNFELFIVRADGQGVPVQVTKAAGADVLPVFTPDGKRLVWSGQRQSQQSQLYSGSWNHSAARALLGLDKIVHCKVSFLYL